MRRRAPWTTVAVVLAVGLLTIPVVAASLESGSPEDAGLSSERMRRIGEAMQRHIDAGAISGGVTAVARHGRLVHLEAHGLMDIESRRPMTADALFKIMSMTKPVAGVAIMILVEEGKVRLDDPVSRFIPELADLQVAVALPQGRGRGAGRGGAAAGGGGRGQAPPFYTMPAERPITIQDLLTHTSGLVSGTVSNAESGRLAPQGPNATLADVIPKLGQVPLEFQPGDRWAYSAARGFDTLLHVVEKVTGQTAGQFLKERIFDPLGMRDTSFWAGENNPRVVTLYQSTADGLRPSGNQTGVTSQTYFSGGGGLVSTAEDYLRFGQMLLSGGEFDGVRILGPRTVDLMASAVLPDDFFGGPGVSFGLSMQVVNDPVAAGLRVGEGSFGWDGAYGTHVWIDPENDLVGLVMLQTSVRQVFRDVENALMQAIVD